MFYPFIANNPELALEIAGDFIFVHVVSAALFTPEKILHGIVHYSEPYSTSVSGLFAGSANEAKSYVVAHAGRVVV